MSIVRAKGQDVRLTFTSPAGTEDFINEGGVASLNMEFKLKLLEEGFLGETANRVDDIYESTSFEAECELTQSTFFQFVKRVMDRAQRRTPAEAVFNLLCTTQFGTGDFGRCLLPDIKFDAVPYQVGGRDEYVKVKFQGACSMPRFL